MENEKTRKTKIVVAFAAGVCIACGIFYAANCFGWFASVFGRTNGVRSDGATISEVKQQLDGAKNNQRELQKTADAIEGTVGDIRQEVSGAREEVGRAEQSLFDAENQSQRAGELIDECQRILDGAGKRVQTKTEAH
ncbi:hypothetical protein [uncultured Phascolarctobacterium sp.]|uniref:hypothetical protein n=1 Tax=uncultured Phascolarctobacterium sp. TaxID=512296 RepID=UPI0025E863D9|nr:hypothetical protein [uncultured Phascolarctobacterium sp.]